MGNRFSDSSSVTVLANVCHGTSMIEDAKTWHQESLRQLECLPDKLPFRCLRGELTDIYVIGERDYDDIMPIIRYQDIGVRQNLMLLEMGAHID